MMISRETNLIILPRVHFSDSLEDVVETVFNSFFFRKPESLQHPFPKLSILMSPSLSMVGMGGEFVWLSGAMTVKQKPGLKSSLNLQKQTIGKCYVIRLNFFSLSKGLLQV